MCSNQQKQNHIKGWQFKNLTILGTRHSGSGIRLVKEFSDGIFKNIFFSKMFLDTKRRCRTCLISRVVNLVSWASWAIWASWADELSSAQLRVFEEGSSSAQLSSTKNFQIYNSAYQNFTCTHNSGKNLFFDIKEEYLFQKSFMTA